MEVDETGPVTTASSKESTEGGDFSKRAVEGKPLVRQDKREKMENRPEETTDPTAPGKADDANALPAETLLPAVSQLLTTGNGTASSNINQQSSRAATSSAASSSAGPPPGKEQVATTITVIGGRNIEGENAEDSDDSSEFDPLEYAKQQSLNGVGGLDAEKSAALIHALQQNSLWASMLANPTDEGADYETKMTQAVEEAAANPEMLKMLLGQSVNHGKPDQHLDFAERLRVTMEASKLYERLVQTVVPSAAVSVCWAAYKKTAAEDGIMSNEMNTAASSSQPPRPLLTGNSSSSSSSAVFVQPDGKQPQPGQGGASSGSSTKADGAKKAKHILPHNQSLALWLHADPCDLHKISIHESFLEDYVPAGQPGAADQMFVEQPTAHSQGPIALEEFNEHYRPTTFSVGFPADKVNPWGLWSSETALLLHEREHVEYYRLVAAHENWLVAGKASGQLIAQRLNTDGTELMEAVSLNCHSDVAFGLSAVENVVWSGANDGSVARWDLDQLVGPEAGPTAVTSMGADINDLVGTSKSVAYGCTDSAPLFKVEWDGQKKDVSQQPILDTNLWEFYVQQAKELFPHGGSTDDGPHSAAEISSRQAGKTAPPSTAANKEANRAAPAAATDSAAQSSSSKKPDSGINAEEDASPAASDSASAKEKKTVVQALDVFENKAILGATDGSLLVLELRTADELVPLFYTPNAHPGGVERVKWKKFSEGDTVFASCGTTDGCVTVYDIAQKTLPDDDVRFAEELEDGDEDDDPPQLLFTHKGHRGDLSDIAWCPWMDWLIASVSNHGEIQAWQMNSCCYGEEKDAANKPTADIFSTCVSNDDDVPLEETVRRTKRQKTTT
ncbi:unnamed protein product [Amoebophrya sp. A120]|nr:unnamed protein product [Amoebophrya sp. A120]|eukprot:GSA120T00023076001.1